MSIYPYPFLLTISFYLYANYTKKYTSLQILVALVGNILCHIFSLMIDCFVHVFVCS